MRLSVYSSSIRLLFLSVFLSCVCLLFLYCRLSVFACLDRFSSVWIDGKFFQEKIQFFLKNIWRFNFFYYLCNSKSNLNRVMKQIETLFQFSHVVKIYIPGTVNENETAADLQKIETENALSFMCVLFGGATCGKFTGAWKNDAGQVITEPVNIVYSFFDGDLAKVLQLVEYAKNLCKRMSQECISIEFDGKLGFITAE